MREEVKQARELVKKVKDPDILGLGKKEWNSSSLTPGQFDRFLTQEDHELKLFKIRSGLEGFSFHK